MCGLVTGGIVRPHGVNIRRRGGQAGVGEVGAGGSPHLGAIAIHAVAGDVDIIGGRVPREIDLGIGDGRGLEVPRDGWRSGARVSGVRVNKIGYVKFVRNISVNVFEVTVCLVGLPINIEGTKKGTMVCPLIRRINTRPLTVTPIGWACG